MIFPLPDDYLYRKFMEDVKNLLEVLTIIGDDELKEKYLSLYSLAEKAYEESFPKLEGNTLYFESTLDQKSYEYLFNERRIE